MTPNELGARLTSAELTELLVYNREQPLPDSWYQTGILATAVHRAIGGRRSRATPEKFIPGRKRREQLSPIEAARRRAAEIRGEDRGI